MFFLWFVYRQASWNKRRSRVFELFRVFQLAPQTHAYFNRKPRLNLEKFSCNTNLLELLNTVYILIKLISFEFFRGIQFICSALSCAVLLYVLHCYTVLLYYTVLYYLLPVYGIFCTFEWCFCLCFQQLAYNRIHWESGHGGQACWHIFCGYMKC